MRALAARRRGRAPRSADRHPEVIVEGG